MALRVASLGLGVLTGFVFAWARMTDPDTFHRMLVLRSPTIYLLMAAAVGVAFIGARLVRGRRALLTQERIAWKAVRPTRHHVLGSALFGVGWGVSPACPGPLAAQLGAGRLLAVAVVGGVIAGVALQPRLAGAASRRHAPSSSRRGALAEADVL